MATPYITIGCPTTGGGKVISGNNNFLVEGIPAACVGDKATCPKHNTVSTILTGDPYMQINGKAVARVNDSLSCGCKLLPQQNLLVGATGPGFRTSNFVSRNSNQEMQDNLVKNSRDYNIVCHGVEIEKPHFSPLGITNSLGIKSSKNIQIVVTSKRGIFDRVVIEVQSKNGLKKICEKKGNFAPAVTHKIDWDGFIDDKYDSTLLTASVGLKLIINAFVGKDLKSSTEKTIKFKHAVKDWVDTKVDKKTKIISHTIRLSLKDGGALGLQNAHKISTQEIKLNKQQPFTSQVVSFNELEKLAVKGIAKHWSRNANNSVGKDIKIENVSYQVNVTAIKSDSKAMDTLKLIFVTNSEPAHSANWIAMQQVSFNVGYLDFNGAGIYRFRSISDATDYFVETFAHECGHDILSAGGSQVKSKLHNKTSTITQKTKEGINYPSNGEIDLMMYGENSRFSVENFYDRVVANEDDVRSLMWISGIKL